MSINLTPTNPHANRPIAPIQFDANTQPIEQKLTELKTELIAAKNSCKTIMKDIKNEKIVRNTYTNERRTYANFLREIKSLSGNNEMQLRLKNGHIKAQKYSGPNLFKQIFDSRSRTNDYLHQGDELTSIYKLPSVKKDEATRFLENKSNEIQKKIDDSNKKIEGLQNDEEKSNIEIDKLGTEIRRNEILKSLP